MATREELEPMVGQMIRINGGSAVMLHALVQATEDEEFDNAWVVGDWLVKTGRPDEAESPQAWGTHVLKNWAEVTVTLAG